MGINNNAVDKLWLSVELSMKYQSNVHTAAHRFIFNHLVETIFSEILHKKADKYSFYKLVFFGRIFIW